MVSAPNSTAPPTLSERELQVLRLVATGATNNQIARELSISVNTVKVHLANIFAKLNVQSRTEATLYAVRHGWIEIERADQVKPESLPASPAPAEPVAAKTVGDKPEDAVQPSIAPPGVPMQTDAPTAPPIARAPSPMRQRLIVAALIAGIVLGLAGYPFLSNAVMPKPDGNASVFASPAPPAIQPVRWQMKAPLNAPREAMAAAVVNGLIYVIGGLAEDKALAEVNVYDPAANQWDVKANKPTALQGSGAAVIGGRIYVPGGCDAQNQPSTVLEIYDPQRDIWQTGAPLPKALCHYAISALEGKLYLLGGWNGAEPVADVWVFDPVRGEWSEHAPLPSPRMDAGAAVLNDRIIVVGGRAGEQLLNETLALDPTQDRKSAQAWDVKASMKHGRGKPGVASLAGNLYVIGGGWSSASTGNERFDSRANAWMPLDESPEPLWRVGGIAALETKLYVIGGWKGAPSASVQEYTALYRFFLPSSSN